LSVSRPWLAFVLILFCLPLFVGLRGLDLETDEAIYSFAADRILEDGEWLRPKSSPSDTLVFLEKPPLKFWIVAAPIRAGLLPRDELGFRFWDAVFGAVSFVYVLAIGWRLAGPVCGAVAVFLLFVHAPLVFEHGLRTNNMESAVLLCYCGGTYHYLAWAGRGARRARHALAVGLYFALGFLTKFVAAIFLPFTLAMAMLLFRSTRTRAAAEWRMWAAIAGLVLALIVPWFVFAQWQFGSLLWETMLTEHVYARFTTALDPSHLQPWHYYVVTMWVEFQRAGVHWVVVAGLILLTIQSVRRRWHDGAVVLLWAAVPLASISFGSSKLYHYAYPFVPPFALAAGYGMALAMMLAPPVLRKVLERVDDGIGRVAPALRAVAANGLARAVAAVFIGVAIATLLWSVMVGPARVSVGRTVLFQSKSAVRPILVILALAVVTRRAHLGSVLIVGLILALFLPFAAYRSTWSRLAAERHPIRDAADCVKRVQDGLPAEARNGLYVDGDGSIWHPINYYFRRVSPWTFQYAPAADKLMTSFRDPASFRPSLVQQTRYRAYVDTEGDARRLAPPMIQLDEHMLLLLPGPYRVCSPDVRLQLAH
jgi:4-amino-4-deoxy-L-arabinose transferase-like glycosyltransferase